MQLVLLDFTPIKERINRTLTLMSDCSVSRQTIAKAMFQENPLNISPANAIYYITNYYNLADGDAMKVKHVAYTMLNYVKSQIEIPTNMKLVCLGFQRDIGVFVCGDASIDEIVSSHQVLLNQLMNGY